MASRVAFNAPEVAPTYTAPSGFAAFARANVLGRHAIEAVAPALAAAFGIGAGLDVPA